jgi:hypothetical protein
MREHMNYIVLSEHRPFSFRDFLLFEVDGKEYRMTAGSFRNKISRLRKSGLVELAYNSRMAFYTLKGHRFGKPMTPNHMGVGPNKSDPIVSLIQSLPMDRNALHNIRLRFESKGLWEFMSTYHSGLPINHISKDILIPTYNIDDLLVRVTVHRTDTVSVLVACPLAPVAADVSGVIRLTSAFARVEERLAALLTGGATASAARVWYNCPIRIPNHNAWIVIMWHFGADSLTEYAGEKFEVTWETGQHALLRAYTKVMKDGKDRIRVERQEYPSITFSQAIEEKLKTGGYRSRWQ